MLVFFYAKEIYVITFKILLHFLAELDIIDKENVCTMFYTSWQDFMEGSL